MHLYQQLISSINFAAVVTHPDIAYAASMLSKHLINPLEHHMELAYKAMHYLNQTKSHSICFDTQMTHTFTTFSPSSDALYADDPDMQKNIQGFIFMLFNGPIDWKAMKQYTVTTSMTETKLLTLSATAKEALWWECFFISIEFETNFYLIQCNNS